MNKTLSIPMPSPKCAFSEICVFKIYVFVNLISFKSTKVAKGICIYIARATPMKFAPSPTTKETVVSDPVYAVPGQFWTVTVRYCLHCRGSKLFRLAVPFTLYRYDLNLMVEHCLEEAVFSQPRLFFRRSRQSKFH